MNIRKRKSKRSKNGYVYEVYFNYQEHGITKRYSKSGFLTKKEANEHMALKKAELKKTGQIGKEIKKTFEDVYLEFLEVGAEQYQPNTIYNTKKYYNYCKDELSAIPITEFDYSLLQKYFNGRKDIGLETNKGIKKTINRVLNYAIKVGYIKSNPLNLVTVKGIETHRNNDEILKYEDFQRLTNTLDSLNDFKRQAYSMAIKIAYFTGLRVSEVVALEKDDILLDEDLMNVDKKLIHRGLKKKDFYTINQMKSKKSKALIPLPNLLKEELINWFKINPYDRVICDIEGYYINPCTLSTDVKKVANNLNISFHFHMLRHTFATNLVTNNVDLKTAQELMRHSKIDTTMSIYTHVSNQHKIDTVNTIFNMKRGENVANLKVN